MTTVLPPPLGSPADTEHTFSRGGRELPLQVHEIGGVTDHGHLLLFGRPADNCLVRIHSRCLYGESLGSDDCDTTGRVTPVRAHSVVIARARWKRSTSLNRR